jgi:hypothetical protein
MVKVKLLVLDVLKPRQPNALGFARILAEEPSTDHVRVVVSEVDDQTETIVVTVMGEDLDFDALSEVITGLGGSVHSVDEVEVGSETDDQ